MSSTYFSDVSASLFVQGSVPLPEDDALQYLEEDVAGVNKSFIYFGIPVVSYSFNCLFVVMLYALEFCRNGNPRKLDFY